MAANNLKEWLEANAPEPIRAAVVAACATKGKNAGRLLSSAPHRAGPEAVGAWRAMMMELCPQRSGFFSIILAAGAERKSYETVSFWLDSTIAGRIVRCAGGRPLQYSMFHWHVNPKQLRQLAAAADIAPEALGVAFCES